MNNRKTKINEPQDFGSLCDFWGYFAFFGAGGFGFYKLESAYTENAEQLIQVIGHLREKGYEIEAIRYTGTLFEAGITGENSVFETPDEALEYARNTGIKKLTIVGEEIKTIDTGVES